jgi:hypothetical protein
MQSIIIKEEKPIDTILKCIKKELEESIKEFRPKLPP